MRPATTTVWPTGLRGCCIGWRKGAGTGTHTEFQRLNTRAAGFEWVCAPVIALTKTDRPLFLINVISFLLMPGLVFSLLRNRCARAGGVALDVAGTDGLLLPAASRQHRE